MLPLPVLPLRVPICELIPAQPITPESAGDTQIDTTNRERRLLFAGDLCMGRAMTG